jgi:hypothetical protein
VFGSLWNRLLGRRTADTIKHETELEQMSPEERHFAEERFEDRQADEVIEERLGGINPTRLLDDDEPPRR